MTIQRERMVKLALFGVWLLGSPVLIYYGGGRCGDAGDIKMLVSAALSGLNLIYFTSKLQSKPARNTDTFFALSTIVGIYYFDVLRFINPLPLLSLILAALLILSGITNAR